MKFEEAMKAYADKKIVGRNKKELMVTSGAIVLGGDLVGKDDVNATDWDVIGKDYIYECSNCNEPLSEEIMGKKCPKCGNWTYNFTCKKEVTKTLSSIETVREDINDCNNKLLAKAILELEDRINKYHF